MSKGESMKIKLWIVILGYILFSPVVFAEDKYKGSISVNIKEDGGSVYTTSTSFETLEKNDVIINFRRAIGERENLSNRALNKDPSKMNYHHFILNVNNVSNDIFIAEIELYSSAARQYTKHLKGKIKANLIVKYNFEGMLYTKNKYIFSDKGKPDINVILEFDKMFSAEEIKERLQQQHITKT